MRSRIDTLLSEGKYAEADIQLRTLLEAQERLVGSEHPHTLTSRRRLADALANRGNPKEAETEYRKLLEIYTRLKGDLSYEALILHGEIARALNLQSDTAAALKEYRTIYDLTVKKYGRYSNAAIGAKSSIAHALATNGDHRAAANEYEKILGDAQQTIWHTTIEIGDKQRDLDRTKESESSYYYRLSLELEQEQQFSKALSYARMAENDYLQRYHKNSRPLSEARDLRVRLEKELQDQRDGKILPKQEGMSAKEWWARENTREEARQWEWRAKAWCDNNTNPLQYLSRPFESSKTQLKLQVASPKKWPTMSAE